MGANFEITNNDSLKVEIFDAIYQESGAELKFSGAATVAENTVLGIAAVLVGVVTDGTNTGNGTCTLPLLAAGGPALIGSYNIECITAVTNGGIFKLESPNGDLLATGITIAAGAGGVIAYEGYGISFLLTDGSTDFAVGDSFGLAVSAVDKYVPFQSDAVDGSEIPKAILTEAKTAAGAGNEYIRPLIGGQVESSVFVFAKSGDDLDTVPQGQTETVRDLLRDYGIIAREGVRVDGLDNQ